MNRSGGAAWSGVGQLRDRTSDVLGEFGRQPQQVVLKFWGETEEVIKTIGMKTGRQGMQLAMFSGDLVDGVRRTNTKRGVGLRRGGALIH
ncbi:hypothetical protein PuT2_14295 [Pusillimonas sp. T2]|nr:hypothetical protein PuT2_14295 [Pusillimonas sp. T2]